MAHDNLTIVKVISKFEEILIRNHSRWRTVYLCFFISFSKALTSECRTLKSVSIMNSPFLSDASFKCLSLCKRLRKIRVEGKLNEFVLFSENVFLSVSGVQGWRSGENTRLPPMLPGFDFQIRRQMWVELVGSLLCTERFSAVLRFLLSSKTRIWLDLC